MFMFQSGNGFVCFFWFIGVSMLVTLLGGALRRASRQPGGLGDDANVCPDGRCAQHNPPYARYCGRCGKDLG